jgi:hypothetical protein
LLRLSLGFHPDAKALDVEGGVSHLVERQCDALPRSRDAELCEHLFPCPLQVEPTIEVGDEVDLRPLFGPVEAVADVGGMAAEEYGRGIVLEVERAITA